MATGAEGNRYGKNQFYNIGFAEGHIFDREFSERGTTDNPQFLWPDDHLRNAVTGRKTKIQRGYMRLVSEVLGTDSSMTALGKRRFHFQFNPDTLTRSVVARNDVHLWMNQDPAQFTQPIPGDANFAFEIVLNREAEMASGRYKTGQGISAQRQDAAFLNQFGPTNDIGQNLQATFLERNGDQRGSGFDPSWVTDIGVLADLLVFDQIIGQGVNRELIQSILNRAEVAVSRANTESQKNVDEEDKEPDTINFNRGQAENYLNSAFGNSAFLISQPVRVVFSSSFMVEGFVTSTNVVFNKFNPAMIPTQCTISVQMQAMYIGFARKNTFLTAVYENTPQNQQEYEQEQGAINEALVGIGKNLYKGLQDREDSRLTPSRFLALNDKSLPVTIILDNRSDVLKTFATEKNGTVTAHAVLQIFYETKSAGYNASTGYAVSSTLPLYQGKQSIEVDIAYDSLALPFMFTAQQAEFPKTYDSGAGAKYRVVFYVYFSLSSNNGGSIPFSEQYYGVVRSNVNWGDNIYPVRGIGEGGVFSKTTPFAVGTIPENIKDIF